MFNRFAMQALRGFNEYPEVPPGWPNRATRRAIKHGKEHRLSAAWRQVLVARPSLRAEIRSL
jgi:hypothetical protein